MLKINVLKRSVALLLAVLLLINCLPLTALAETTTASTDNDEEYIYYSDLFYGYSSYLNDLEFLSNHVEAQGTMNTAFNQYLNSPQFTWAAISKHISLTTSMSDLMIAYSDVLGLTNVSYNDNLDEANKKFAQALFEMKVSDIESISKDTKCIGQFKKIISTLQKVWKAIYDTQDIKTYDTFVDLAYADMQEYCTNLKPLLPSLKSGTYTAMSELLSAADDTKEILDIFTALIISLGMEEIRLDVIKDIIETQESDTILYEGMNRLYSQLKNGFVRYFIDTYFAEKLIEEVSKKAAKYITSSIMKETAEGIGASSAKTLTSVFGAVTASVGLINTIVFDWILGDYVPSIEDYQVTMILAQYSDLMRYSVVSKQSVFQTQFKTNDIENYETLMEAYASSMRCALNECSTLVASINSETKVELEDLTSLYGDNFYIDYIDDIKSKISSIPVKNRIVTDFGTWRVSNSMTVYGASDTLEDNALYFGKVFKGDIDINGTRQNGHCTVTIPEVADVYINGDLGGVGEYDTLVVNGRLTANNLSASGASGSSRYYSHIYNNNEIVIKNNADIQYTFLKQSDDAKLYVGGSYNFVHGRYGDDYENGTIIFNGNEQQTVSGLAVYNIDVQNPKGIKYGNNPSIYGNYKLNGNPVDNNGYGAYIYDGASFDQISDYKKLYIQGNVNLRSSVKADIEINGSASNGTRVLTIPSGADVIVDGDLIGSSQYDRLVVHGRLTVNNLSAKGSSGSSRYYSYIYNYNKIVVKGNVDIRHTFLKQSDDAKFYVGGSYNFVHGRYGDDYENGTIIFNGNEQQTVSGLQFTKIVLENLSDEGVIFKSHVTANILFNHQGNNFTLYNNGSGSTFVDYDGDGMKDNVDPEPTVGNPCTLYFKSDDAEKGSVSLDELETIGGTEITVTATPSLKYEFVKWVNSAGTTVSTSAKYKFVAKNDDTYTAVFSKRQQPIITQTDGGTINVPTTAEIESEVPVTVIEDAGYVYTEGSLAYNNIPVQNGSFVMPDEAVTLTAEFVRNENYFLLSDMISVAKSYTYESYSAASFSKLTSAIARAEVALVNNITAEDSENHISLLQASIDGLQEKYITMVALDTTPTLYINVPDMINNISVLVTYDNGTTITIAGSECTIVGYDSTILGEQSITVEYGGVSGVIKVDVQKRLIAQCIIDVNNQVYDGVKEQYTPTPIVSYIRTGETLTENVDFTLEYKYHTEIGTALVIVTGIGNYTGRRIVNFDIYCEHNYECYEYVEPTCIQTGYKKEKCTICGESKIYTNVVTEGLPESEHNYANNSDVSYTYTDEGAYSLILAFSNSTLTESSFDKIYIYDEQDALVGTYSGSALAGKTITVQGDAVRIRLTSDKSVVKYGFSLDSITAYFDRIFLPTIEHTYGEWSTVTEPTPDEVGMKHKLCTECGDEITEEIPMLSKPAFKGASLSLHHNLAINYKVDKALFDEVGYTKPYVVFEIGEVKTTVKEYTIDNERYVFKFQNIAPNQMNDVIYATLYATYNGVEYASETREYSVAEYCYSMLDTYGADEYAELRTLLVDLLHYGAQSQLYTDYNIASLVDANLTDEQLLWGTNEEQVLTDALNTAYETVENPTAKWKGAGLTLTDSVSMRFKFTTDSIDGLSVKIKSATDEWNITSDKFIEEDGVCYVYFNGLNAGQMREKVYLTIYDDDVAVSNTVCYSIESYAYEKQDSSIAYLSDLVKAMMKYGNSAYAYAN